MPRQLTPSAVATIGIDIGTFHLVDLDQRGSIVLQLKSSREQLERRLANLPRCLIGMEACSGSHLGDLDVMHCRVIGLRLRHEIAHRHVFNHAPAQRADALIGHGILLSEPKVVGPSIFRKDDSALPHERFRSMIGSGH